MAHCCFSIRHSSTLTFGPKLAFAVELSANRKTGPVSVTHVSQVSCPPACALKGTLAKPGPCYAEYWPQGIQTRQLNKVEGDSADAAEAEASAIDRLSGRRPLRLHVVGDCATPSAAWQVSGAATRYSARHGQPVWTYTHGWRDVPRSAWRNVNVLASCETLLQVTDAHARGYATCLVVVAHPADGRAELRDGWCLIPCPAQTRDVQCTDCKLCWRDRELRDRRAVITFAAHGPGAPKLRKLLEGV